MKLILTVAAYVLVLIAALNLFNNGNVGYAFLLAIVSIIVPLYLHIRKGNIKDEKS